MKYCSLLNSEAESLIAEILRLRELCGRAEKHPWRVSSIADEKMKRELRAE
jgi:hypothetical protein